jgi:hypothetical protein
VTDPARAAGWAHPALIAQSPEAPETAIRRPIQPPQPGWIAKKPIFFADKSRRIVKKPIFFGRKSWSDPIRIV